MKNILMSLLVFTVGSVALAQEAKVIKVKGQQAIVTFPSGTKPQVGQTIDLGGGGVSGEAAGVGTGSRNNVLALSGQIAVTNSNSNTTTQFAVSGRYGWNQETIEFGPIVTLGYSSSPNLSSRTIAGGGFFDFNFTPNKSGVRGVMGLTADAQFGQDATKVASNPESTSTTMDFFVGGTYKYFGFADNVAIRGDAGLEYDRDTSGSTTTTSTGLKVLLGLAFYY
ncbi:MAG: hypothetical protein V4760_15840 [Bdellovibrionota bacterium]